MSNNLQELKDRLEKLKKSSRENYNEQQKIRNEISKTEDEELKVGNVYQENPHSRLIVSKIDKDDADNFYIEVYQVKVYDSWNKQNNTVRKFTTSRDDTLDGTKRLETKASKEDLDKLEICFQNLLNLIELNDPLLQTLSNKGIIDRD